MFGTIIPASGLTLTSVLLCSAASLALGLVAALVSMYRSDCSRDFAVTLVLMPVMVQTVIMMVNGNIGAGVAVAGTFSLVRFRSAPGTAREICCIFFSMAVGLATGMGYIGFAAVATAVIAISIVALSVTGFGDSKTQARVLDISIPENLDYTDVFDDILKKYTVKAELERVKTTNMGSLFDLRYRIVLADIRKEKSMIDELRCRNGNLRISCARSATERETL